MYRVFTIKRGFIEDGAAVQSVVVANQVTIRAVVVGEEGRGRTRGLLPVSGSDAPKIVAASVGKTRSGNSKLVVDGTLVDNRFCIVVFLVEGGFRGSVHYSGDFTHNVHSIRSDCELTEQGFSHFQEYTDLERADIDAAHPGTTWESGRKYAPFPGCVLSAGHTAEGIAGRAGCHEQIVAVIPKGEVFRLRYDGRLYGAPGEHYLVFDGTRIQMATREEREAMDLW